MNRYLVLSRIIGASVLIFLGLNLAMAGALMLNQWRHRSARTAVTGPGAPDFSYREKRPELSEPVIATRHAYQEKWIDLRAYGSAPAQDIYKTLDDYVFRSRFTYEPYTGYADAPNASATLNVVLDKHGFSYRKNGADTAPNAYKIFLFGGSTTFGVNVADNQTLPAHLEKLLSRSVGSAPLEVRNYGRCGYSWTQELVLLTRLLQSGERPDHVMFLDGVNLPAPHEAPLGSQDLSDHWDYEVMQAKGNSLPNFIPIFRYLNARKAREARRRFADLRDIRHGKFVETGDSSERAVASYKRFVGAAREIAKEFGVEANFYLQPNRAYQCQSERYRTPLDAGYSGAIQPVYRELEKFEAEGFTSLARLCESAANEWLFVDEVHYNDFMNARIAESILGTLHLSPAPSDHQG